MSLLSPDNKNSRPQIKVLLQVLRPVTAAAQFFFLGLMIMSGSVLVFSQVAGAFIRYEAEQGAISGSALSSNDITASGGAYLLFNTTTPPPTGVQFQAQFETSADFDNNFEFHVGNYCGNARLGQPICWPENDPLNAVREWPGDHNMACEGPTTLRTIHMELHDEMFWWCAPKGPESGHVMTSLNTEGYTIIAFAPKRSFTNVKRICWEVNQTQLGGGKWTNVVVVPQSEYLRHPNPSPQRMQDHGEGPYRLDYVTPMFNNDGEVGDFNIQDDDLGPGGYMWGLRNMRGTLQLFRNDDILWDDPEIVQTTDKAARYRHCMIENSNNTLTITRARPDGATDNFTVSNAQIPDGEVRIIFQDDNYNPPKRDGYHPDNNTWHWDNIVIE